MSHVSEGALHAYLDGALDEYPTGEARRVRAHLERCAECAAALAEARALRDRTDRILAAPELDVSPPPFEEIKRLARSIPEVRMGPRLRLYRFGWAASVVLAVGAGWLLRDARTEGPADLAAESFSAPGARTSAEAGDRVAAAPLAEVAPTSGAPSQGAGVTPEAGGLAPPATARVADGGDDASRSAEGVPADVGGREVGALADAGAAGVTPATEPEVAAQATRISEAPVAGAAGGVGAGAQPTPVLELPPLVGPGGAAELPAERVAAADVAPAPDREAEAAGADGSAIEQEREPLPSPSAPRAALELQVGGATGLGVPGAFDLSRRQESEEAPDDGRSGSDPGSLVVPGLEVLSIVWREEGVTPAGVRVVQLLEDGGTLELIHLPEGIDPASVEPVAPGVGELRVPREGGWLILRAERTDSELRALLRRLDEAPPA